MMRTLSLCAALAMATTLTACATPQEPIPQYRITAHYIGSGEVGQAKAYVYSGNTVVELETATTGANVTDRQGFQYSHHIDGRYIVLNGIAPEVSVQAASRSMYFTLAPASKVYTPNGMAIIEE